MKCEDCNKECWHFQSNSKQVAPRVYRTSLYFRCPKCGTVYVEFSYPVNIDTNERVDLCDGKEYPYIEKCPVKKPVTLDNWFK